MKKHTLGWSYFPNCYSSVTICSKYLMLQKEKCSNFWNFSSIFDLADTLTTQQIEWAVAWEDGAKLVRTKSFTSRVDFKNCRKKDPNHLIHDDHLQTSSRVAWWWDLPPKKILQLCILPSKSVKRSKVSKWCCTVECKQISRCIGG